MSQESPGLGHPLAKSLQTTEAVQQLTAEAFSDIRVAAANCRRNICGRGDQGTLPVSQRSAHLVWNMATSCFRVSQRGSPERCPRPENKMEQMDEDKRMGKKEEADKEETEKKQKKLMKCKTEQKERK